MPQKTGNWPLLRFVHTGCVALRFGIRCIASAAFCSMRQKRRNVPRDTAPQLVRCEHAIGFHALDLSAHAVTQRAASGVNKSLVKRWQIFHSIVYLRYGFPVRAILPGEKFRGRWTTNWWT